MAILKRIFVVVVLMSCIIKVKSGKNPRRDALRSTLLELDALQSRALRLMTLIRHTAGYGPFPGMPCGLDTSMIYKEVVLKQDTLVGHLTRIEMVLKPLSDASLRIWASKSISLNKTLANVSFYIQKARMQLYYLDPSINPLPLVKYKSSILDKKVNEYLQCVGIQSNPNAVQILSYATFLESVHLAISSYHMQNDIVFLQNY